MSTTTDRAMAALKPAALDDLDQAPPDEAMDAQISRIVATPRTGGRSRRRGVPRMPLLLTAGLATAAAAAVVIPQVVNGSGGATHPRPSNPPAAAPMEARKVLLAGAQSAERAQGPADGKYWHLKTRRCAPGGYGQVPYHYTVCTTQDSWTSKTGFDRNLLGIDQKIVFATPGDKAKWQSAGSPKLTESRAYTEHRFPVFHYWGLDGNRKSLDELRRLPSDPSALRKMVAKTYRGTPKTSADLDDHIWLMAPELFNQPITPATRAGLYRMLAQIKGVRNTGITKDVEGRDAIVLQYGDTRLAFRADTHEFLSDDFQGGGTFSNAQLQAEWTNVMGARQGERGYS
ncbi:CU044_5270 family protein [Actinomadura barringtoniae]|uniref:CU044_5270 family protein n=1 Tax=Actinomadura barringtoniae TaxID=1427535 RepID=A0A939PIJ6_9ACTN|nr:CU044_5270 family protein [Actinomadura barringtoniae]MBO2449191.1 CU044_5270 family protein [Actinomadura barringtoniae]